VLNLPLLIVVLRDGRWTPRMRRLSDALALATCAVMLWTVLDGPVLLTKPGDEMAKFAMVLVVGMTLLGLGYKWYQRVNPAPAK